MPVNDTCGVSLSVHIYLCAVRNHVAVFILTLARRCVCTHVFVTLSENPLPTLHLKGGYVAAEYAQ